VGNRQKRNEYKGLAIFHRSHKPLEKPQR